MATNLREDFGGVDSLALAVEVLDAHAIRVEIATVGVAITVEPLLGVGTTTAGIRTDVVLIGLTRVRCHGRRMGIRF